MKSTLYYIYFHVLFVSFKALISYLCSKDPKDAKLGKVGGSGRTLLAEQAIEDTSSPGGFVAVDAKLLKDYDDSMRQLLERQSAPRVDWMGNVLPPMEYVPLKHGYTVTSKSKLSVNIILIFWLNTS